MDYSDSESYDSDSYGAAPHAQASMGDNNIMTTGNSHGYHPQHSSDEDNYRVDDDSSEARSVGSASSRDGASSNEEDNDDDEPPTAVAAPVQPRGKTFRPPVGVGDGNSSSSEEEDNAKPPASHTATATAQVINPNPGPRGKELRLIMNKEPTKTGTRSKSSRATKGNAAKKVAAKATTTTSNKKRKTPPANHDSDSGSDDDDNACIATIVGGSDTEEVMAVATNISSSTKRMKGNNGSAVKKTAPKKASVKKGGAGSNAKAKPKSTGVKKSPPTTSASSVQYRMPVISAEKAAAAHEARTTLQGTVSTLPYRVTDTHIIRSFGRIKPEYNTTPLDAQYSSPHAIYPVGFSYDRFEFSPIHGRVIKMRCDILDGSSLREYREERMRKLKAGKSKSDKSSEPSLVDERLSSENGTDFGDGPVFRVTWGEGVEEDKILEKPCPFDPYLASAHLGGDVDAIAVPLSSKKGSKPVGLPEVGMRVSVRFDKCKLYWGTITHVKPLGSQAKNKKAVCNIAIQYDDGVTEIAAFPDPDIILAYQGFPPVETVDGYVTEMNGKPVRSVLAKSPIEAWGKTLLSLGLIDEVIYDVALNSLLTSRDAGFDDKYKINMANKKRSDDKGKETVFHLNDVDGDVLKSEGMASGDRMDTDTKERADVSQEELHLRKQLREMHEKLDISKRRSKLASMSLANARIATISPFAANPFVCREDSASLESSWLAAAIKREKAKMGNTGNKRKIVTPATIMEKNDTFFVDKIERLVEGLPGSEFAPSYVFHANRSSSKGNQAWIQEAKIRHQRRQQKEQKEQEKSIKMSKQGHAKAKAEEQKVLKRKIQEVAAADKKRLKSEEEEQKRRERINKRLLLLNTQMEERLSKEASMMREKSITNLVRAMSKEFVRRRKAAELIVGNNLDRLSSSSTSMNSSSNVLVPFNQMLPPISRVHNFEVVKLWDFLHSFSNIFSLSTTQVSPSTLDDLQDAFNCLHTNGCDKQMRANAVQMFTGIAIDLCKVISPGLTKSLSSSTQNVDVVGKNGTDGGPQGDADVSCLPVTEWSWREIARMVIINDILTDLGFSKQEAANLVKGYRSGGHPNSKEAKRWKKIEESPVAMMYQIILDGDASNQFRRRVMRATLSTPCAPSSVPSDWRFFLHNIKSRSSTPLPYIKDNVAKSLVVLKQKFSDDQQAQSHVESLESCLAMLECENGTVSTPELHKAKQLAISVLDSSRDTRAPPSFHCNPTDSTQEPARQKMGYQKMFQMSREKFKALEQSKEEYMAAALRLKEELEFKTREGDDDDDEDEDEEVEDFAGETDADIDVLDRDSSPPIDSVDNRESTQGESKGAANDNPGESEADKEVTERESALSSDSSNKRDFEDEEMSRCSTLESSEKIERDGAGNVVQDLEADASIGPSTVEEASNTTGHPTVSEKDSHLPTEPAEDFPDGWEVRRIPRLNPTDKRTDRNWYSPKLGLKFRAKSDALRFLGLVEAANGDEAAAIMEFHGKNTNGAASKVGNKPASTVASTEDSKAGSNKAEYEFCEDDPLAPDIIRRCLAVIRSLCGTNSAEQFIYPVDPQLYPGYYESVMNPCSLYDVAKFLQDAGQKFSSDHTDPEIEEVVADVGRKVRTIVQNSICVMSSNNIVNSAEEMLRIFERLFFDWVLAPSKDRPQLEDLDDDMCIDHHESDLHSMVLLCDACEGKYNMSRLKPELDHVPDGDWYCPRCVAGRSWLTADPRIGRQVQNESFSGIVQSCKFLFTDVGNLSILYRLKSINSGRIEYWGVEDVDKSMVGDPVEPIRCLTALSESPGYGFGRDFSILGGAIPLAINPLVGDKAAQAALSNVVFKDTVSACVSLTHPPEDYSSEEWITILLLLVSKCSQSDELQDISSKLESKVAASLSTNMMTFWRARAAKNIVPNVSDDDSVSSEESEPCDAPADVPSAIEKTIEFPTKTESPSTDIAVKSSGEEEVIAENRPTDATDMDISFNSSLEGPDEVSSNTVVNASVQPSNEEASSNTAANTTMQPPNDVILTEEEIMRRKRESSILAKSKRERKREEALIGYFIGTRLKSTAASFEEDFLSTIVKSTLCNQEEGLDFSAVRCRETCHYCGLSDVALGAPLCRTPDESEWREMFPYALHGRNTFMIAQVPDNDGETISVEHENRENQSADVLSTEPATTVKVFTVRVRVGGVLVSSRLKSDDSAKNSDSVMQQFLPRNPIGFQSELKFRHQSSLTILTGSLSAHEVCAIAAHRSLKDKLLAERRNFYRSNLTREAALTCGKSTPIGTDPFGRSYWVFSADPTSLFVCEMNSTPDAASPTLKRLHRFHKPEEIASVIVCLGRDPLCETLKEIFPEATKVVNDRSWSTLLMERSLRRDPEATEALPISDETKVVEEEQTDFGAPFVEDEDVLVESANGKFLWDAVIVDVSKDPETAKVYEYLVHYKNWSSRFDQWVVPERVVEPSKVNLEVQEEVIQDFTSANDVAPPELECMFAYKFLNAKKRARSTPVSKAELFECSFTRPSASHDEKLLGLLKGAILLIEAALPRGSVNGVWNPQAAALWRNFVKDAQGPESLMKCVLLLENAISPFWLHSQATQLYSSIPTQWRAMGEASLSAIALRVGILDRCLKYQQKKKQP